MPGKQTIRCMARLHTRSRQSAVIVIICYAAAECARAAERQARQILGVPTSLVSRRSCRKPCSTRMNIWQQRGRYDAPTCAVKRLLAAPYRPCYRRCLCKLADGHACLLVPSSLIPDCPRGTFQRAHLRVPWEAHQHRGCPQAPSAGQRRWSTVDRARWLRCRLSTSWLQHHFLGRSSCRDANTHMAWQADAAYNSAADH